MNEQVAERFPQPDMNKCYQCVYRGEVPGSAHSSCKHPGTKEVRDRPMVGLMVAMSGGHIPPMTTDNPKVTGNPVGVRGGWFGWPFNFDPVWLATCDGFKQKDGVQYDPQQRD